MSVTYNQNVRNARLQVVANAIDAGSGNGILVVAAAGGAPIITSITLAKPCGTVASGVLTFSGLPLTQIAGLTATAGTAYLTDSTGTVVASGLTVGLPGSGADLIMSQVGVVGGDILTLTAATITGN